MAATRPPFALLSVAANLERHKLASAEPFLLLLSLQYPGAADPTAEQFYVRLARNTHDVSFDCGDGFGVQAYQRFNFELGDFTTSSTGAVPESSIKVSNVMRILQATIEQFGGLVGANLNLYVVSAANPGGEAELALSFTIKDASCDDKFVTFKLGASSPLRRLFPVAMYRPNYCQWTYNSPALQAFAAANPTWKNPGRYCGYQAAGLVANLTAGSTTLAVVSSDLLTSGLVAGLQVFGPGIVAGTTTTTSDFAGYMALSAPATATIAGAQLRIGLATCSHTLDGATGCKAHFPNGPMRALCFPGIDSNGAAVASVV